MSKDLELENYLSISPYKFAIYLFDKKNLKNLYKDELIIIASLDNQNIISEILEKKGFQKNKHWILFI